MSDLLSVELNNSATTLIHSGSSQEAMEFLQLALSNLRDQFRGESEDSSRSTSTINTMASMQRPQSQHEAQPARNRSTPSSLLSSGIAMPPSAVAVTMSLLNVLSVPTHRVLDAECSSADFSFLALFDRSLCIDPSTLSSNMDDNTTVSAVILYNMGLLHHARGLDSGVMEFLNRAHRLYHIALDILKRHSYTPDDSATCTCGGHRLLHLALYNNAAHIDSILIRMDDMKVSLEQMSSLLILQEEASYNMNFLDVEDVMIFSFNAMYGTNERILSTTSAA